MIAKTPAERDGDRHLSPLAYRALALLAGVIGLSASYVTARLFSMAIQATEPDGASRELLLMTATLFVVAELAGFFIVGLLPVHRLRSLRWQLTACAVALVAFEAVSIYGARVALVQSADARAEASKGRAQQLRASIDASRSSAAAFLAAGQRSSQSVIAASRADGAQSIRHASELEGDIQRMVDELARLEAARAPTATAVFGEAGVVALAIAQSLLISGIGLLFLGAAGALLRVARDARCATPVPLHVTTPQVQGMPRGATPAMPSWSRYASAATASLATLGAAPAPARPMQCDTRPVVTDAPSNAPTDAPADAERFQRVREGIEAGHVKPSIRGIYAAEGASQVIARRYLLALERAGVIESFGPGRGYRLSRTRAVVGSRDKSHYPRPLG